MNMKKGAFPKFNERAPYLYSRRRKNGKSTRRLRPAGTLAKSGRQPQSIEKPYGFFDAKEGLCVRLKFSRISGRRTDLWCCFFSQCAHWEKKSFPAHMSPGTIEAPQGLC
jgi:hypothetical protein